MKWVAQFDGQSLWYLGQYSALILNEPSNWATHFKRYEYPDSDNDDVPDSCDACPGSNDAADSDSDGVPNGCDQCNGSDDSFDADDDGVPDGCDICEGDDATGDSDNDDFCDDIDVCSLGDDSHDSDNDDVPDACDQCLGDDASGNGDNDAYHNRAGLNQPDVFAPSWKWKGNNRHHGTLLKRFRIILFSSSPSLTPLFVPMTSQPINFYCVSFSTDSKKRTQRPSGHDDLPFCCGDTC